MILRVGLTGGIASGKSTVARHFAALGCHVIDADAIVARLYRRGEAGYEALVRHYGAAILRGDGEIDRPKLAAIAMATPESAKTLNTLIHPLVIAEQTRELAALDDGIAVVEATLLIESGGRERYDKLVVVDLDPDMQLARAAARGMDRDDASRRIARQLPREERLRHADYVIDNRGDARALEMATRDVYEKLQRDLELKQKRPAGEGGASTA